MACQFNDVDVHDLSLKHLKDVLFEANKGFTPLSYLEAKSHVQYLIRYLGKSGLNATFAISEREYINRDYLTDYSAYYSTCFEPYEKVCVRLHFFSSQSTRDEFLAKFRKVIIEGAEMNKDFWDREYLGYIVIKPTPNHFIGFTLLKHFNYNSNGSIYKNTREYWGTKEYKVHVYGNEIYITSLAFQEKDKNVAACATIAVWTMLQRAAEDYYVILQSPGEITRETGLVAVDGNRLIPNKSLSWGQMAQAITKNNLVTEVRTFKKINEGSNSYLKRVIHAYARLRIPVIFGTIFPDSVERHAVAISGYNINPNSLLVRKKSLFRQIHKKCSERQILWKAECIDTIYVHDDHWGPFARWDLLGTNKIGSDWNSGGGYNEAIQPDAVLMCLFPKVRIPFDDIASKIISLDDLFNRHIKRNSTEEFIWDIQLFFSEDFKKYIQQSKHFDDSDAMDAKVQFKFITTNLPKYIWVATLYSNEDELTHFIYDATGLSESNLLLSIIGYSSDFSGIILKIFESYKTNPEADFIFEHNLPSYISKINEYLDLP